MDEINTIKKKAKIFDILIIVSIVMIIVFYAVLDDIFTIDGDYFYYYKSGNFYKVEIRINSDTKIVHTDVSANITTSEGNDTVKLVYVQNTSNDSDREFDYVLTGISDLTIESLIVYNNKGQFISVRLENYNKVKRFKAMNNLADYLGGISVTLLIASIIVSSKFKKDLVRLKSNSPKSDNVGQKNSQLLTNQRFCLYCGGALNQKDIKCPHCGAGITNDNKG